MKNILILGGTQFIGRNLVDSLLKNKAYSITLFNRNKTGPSLFPNTSRIQGDRETIDINKICEKRWDIVIDVSCYYPHALQQTINALASPPDHYILISSCSVYDDAQNQEELTSSKAIISECSAEQAVDRSNASYGQRKAECDRILMKSGLPYTILRPALVYGIYDHTDRFYYWLHQVRTYDILVLPNHGHSQFSITYVKDLIQMITTLVSLDAQNSCFNAVSHPAISIAKIVSVAAKLLEKRPEIINASPAFLINEQISQWTDMPLWIDGNHFTYTNEYILKKLNSQPILFTQSTKETISYYSALEWPTPTYGMTEHSRQHLIQKLIKQS